MRGMLKVELFHFRNNWVLWVVLAVLVAPWLFPLLSGTFTALDGTTVLSRDIMLVLVAGAAYGGITLPEDFSCGMIRHYIASGHSRSAIATAKFLHYLFGCTLLLLLYPLLLVLLAALVPGSGASLPAMLELMLDKFIKTFPFYWACFALYFFLAMLIQKGAATVGVTVVFSIMSVLVTNTLVNNHILSENFEYIPFVQLVMSSVISDEKFPFAVLCALLFVILMLAAGIARLHFEEF